MSGVVAVLCIFAAYVEDGGRRDGLTGRRGGEGSTCHRRGKGKVMGNPLRLDISSKHVSKLFLPVCMYGCLAGATTGTFIAQNLSCTLWAYAMMRREPGTGLMRELEGRAEALADTFIAQDVSKTLWAYTLRYQGIDF